MIDNMYGNERQMLARVPLGRRRTQCLSFFEEHALHYILRLVKNYSQFVSFLIYTLKEKGITKEVEVDVDLVEDKEADQNEQIELLRGTGIESLQMRLNQSGFVIFRKSQHRNTTMSSTEKLLMNTQIH